MTRVLCHEGKLTNGSVYRLMFISVKFASSGGGVFFFGKLFEICSYYLVIKSHHWLICNKRKKKWNCSEDYVQWISDVEVEFSSRISFVYGMPCIISIQPSCFLCHV